MECAQVGHLRHLPAALLTLLEDPHCTDVLLNGPNHSFADCGEGLRDYSGAIAWSASEMKNWLLQELSFSGKSWDAKQPFVDGNLSTNAHRFHAIFPPVASDHVHISIRRTGARAPGAIRVWSPPEAFELLQAHVRRGESVVISGATGSGKTTLLNDLIAGIAPRERIIALEDTPELFPKHPHFLRLISRSANPEGFGQVTLFELMKQTLRMRPDRIILGECRGPEVLELLLLLNTGHRGAMATIHANSAREALKRIELLALLGAKGSIPVSVIRELLALGLRFLVQVVQEGGLRRIREIWQIGGREGDTILLRPVLQENNHEHNAQFIQ